MGNLSTIGATPIEVIAEEISEMVLSETFLNKNTLKPRIESLIRIFFQKHVTPKNGDTHKDPNTYQKTIHKIQFEERYWRGELKKILSPDQMQAHYNKVNDCTKDMFK